MKKHLELTKATEGSRDPNGPICVNLTSKCNWRCSYCITDTHTKNDLTDEEKINLFKEGLTYCWENKKDLTLSGGEPGLINHRVLNIMLNSVKSPEERDSRGSYTHVNTNGRFFEYLKLFPEQLEKLDSIRLHLVADVDKFFKLPPEICSKIIKEQIDKAYSLEYVNTDLEFAQVFCLKDTDYIDQFMNIYIEYFNTNNKEIPKLQVVLNQPNEVHKKFNGKDIKVILLKSKNYLEHIELEY